MYDPSQGRWTEEDPAGFEACLANLYRYCVNDPANASDPSGLAEEDEWKPRGKPADNPDLEFWVTKEAFGSKTAPFGAGSDSEQLWAGGAMSQLRIYGISQINTCNTPLTPFTGVLNAHGGALVMQLKQTERSRSGKPTKREYGTYTVRVKVRADIERSKADYSSPNVILKLLDAADKEKQANLWEYRLAAREETGSKETVVTVDLEFSNGAWWQTDISERLALVPTMSFTGDKDNYVGVKLYMRVLSVKKK
jgi:hypothetical protein